MSWLRSRALSRSVIVLFSRITRWLSDIAAPRPLQVADHLVGGKLSRCDARRDADAVEGSAADGQPGLNGDPFPDPADPVQVTDCVLRKPPAPPGHPDGGRLAGHPRRRCQVVRR